MEKLIQKSSTYKIIGICMEVHRVLGFGFLEIVYKDAIEAEAYLSDIQVCREKEFQISYKGNTLQHKFYADFVFFDNIILEVKSSKDGIANEHISQTLNYMKASACKIGLIINFGKTSLEHKRLIL